MLRLLVSLSIESILRRPIIIQLRILLPSLVKVPVPGVMYLLGLLWIPDFLGWILVVLTALYVYSTWTHSSLSAYGYKGPWPKPFVGNLDLTFIKSGYFGQWDITGKKLYGKVFAMYDGRTPTIVSFDPEIIKQVTIKNFSHFVDRRELFLRGDIIGKSLLDIRGSHWRHVRNLTSPFFTTGKLRKNMPHLETCVGYLMKRLETYADGNKPLELKEFAGAYTMDTICLTAFGVKVDSNSNPDHPLIVSSNKMVKLSPSNWGLWVTFACPFLGPFLEWLGCSMWPEGSINVLARLTKELIDDRKQSHQERPDFLQMLLKAHEQENITEEDSDGVMADPDKKNKPLTEKEVMAQMAVFMLAGYDTVSTAMSFLLYNLAIHQDCQEKVVQEINDVMGDGEITFEKIKDMEYLNMCFDESLRLYPSVLRVDRQCNEDTNINGYFIPKDAVVVLPIMSLHRDPEFWDKPEEFDPERFSPEKKAKISPYVYMPFGVGPRNCVGMRLAQLEIRYAVIHILRRYKITVSSKSQLPIKLETSFAPKVAGGMWINITKRN